MTQIIDITVPDLGGASDVEIIEVLVKAGDGVDQEDALITLESDKASMDVPSPKTGKIVELLVSVGQNVNPGDLIAKLEITAAESSQETEAATASETPAPAASADSKNADDHADLVVIGSGPGGYTAAFRAADLGLNVTLIEKYPDLGGVCLNVGCIPSKALLHSAAVISEARAMAQHGISFGKPKIDVDKLRHFKESVIGKLTGGLAGMAKARKVNVVQGYAKFTSSNSLSIESENGTSSLSFDKAIIAAGSRVTVFPIFETDDPRVIDSTGALALKEIPKTMLIVGGGIIGLEMATVYSELGTEVTIVEFMPQIIPGADKDLVAPLQKRLKSQVKEILTNTKVESIRPLKGGISVKFAAAGNGNAPEAQLFDYVLVATGRRPNGDLIDADKAGVEVDERGFIAVNNQMQTNVAHIFAIGDIVGQPMLAHKATHEAKVAAEVCAGEKSGFEASVIPSVAYTDPEIAWVGLTETQAKEQGVEYETGVFPWAASGRAIGNDRTEGKTKLLFDPKTHRVLGGGIVGTNAGDLIAEVALAIEMGSDASDIGLTIHPHPTLSETVAMAAEAYEGTITDLYIPKKK
ncbi:dihydrolipoyl dehydrogenase [Arenicella chitinivorans]|uniref:Dihydrolipoyl dehydrogenase n=1 Tax=Arenicella chitinivorans TaxID=1329800 RepID=A0A918RK91_9GAMM|nr:dihydrolipoyl dehydrogenase [Arenicella chitinivorans]GHA02145.1 dihydrolipoyl dehydrogenase [Arenicella chitinivorans]